MMLLQNNEQRLEYDHGDISALTGSSANQAAISANMWRALDDALGEDTACRAYMVDRVVRHPHTFRLGIPGVWTQRQFSSYKSGHNYPCLYPLSPTVHSTRKTHADAS
ncbi:MAG TPA: hypothetical protein VEV19_10645 [Ktedonobacteraceae bacterium]|nr:hypothetical protein [Ktedonobacteraceae bacterium]